jgi:methylenetetrahydrofolate dehydrogenase (NADP+)/methenyltetrahydrofolate cyclohydrolase
MPAKLLKGKPLADEIYGELQVEVQDLKEQGIIPALTAIILGDDPGARLYMKSKERACQKVGIEFESIDLPSSTKEKDLLETLHKLNDNPKIHGVIVELPLPPEINPQKVNETLSPEKDVDGLHPENMGKLFLGPPKADYFIPSTPAGVLELLLRSEIPLEGKDVVIVGRSSIVGKPLAALLSKKGYDATVTLCHSRTKNIESHTRRADILIAALGKPEFITGDMIKEGSIVVDVGINEVKDASRENGYRICGDIHFESAKEIASHITPVPGGVGPVTTAMLLKNVVKAARKQLQ